MYVCMYVCTSVTLIQIDSSFLFLDGIESFFGHQFSMWHSTKRCSSIFDLGPLSPKIDSPKFGQKSTITRLVWQTDQRCLCLLGGFRGWPIQWNNTKCCGADPCCHGNENLGYFFTKIDSSFLFLNGIEPYLGRQFSMWHSTKRCSSIFDLGPLMPKIYSPKFALAQNHL